MQKIFKKQALKTKQISKKKSDSMNILFVMADSLSPHDLGCYGNSCALTPNIDKLAKSGVLFNRAYCNSPLSAPSRASMVTGRYCSELNVFDNANEFRGDIPTIGNVLQLANYETVICGKMHFIGYDQYHGFNQRLALETDYSQSYDPNAFRFAYDWERNGRNPDGPIYMAGSYVALPRWDNHPVNGHYDRDQTIHQKALEYLSEKDANSDPFFCCVSYHTPHNPFWIPEKYKSSFRGKQLPFPENAISTHGIMDDWLNEFHHVIDCRDQLMQKESIRWLYETYYGMVNYLDCLIGELVAAIDRQGLRDNTVIVFASDHGDMLCHRGMVQKRYFYERSVRVPLIFVLPHQLRRGVRSDELVSLLDITPTFAELVKTSCYDVRGNSLVPLMTSVYSMGTG